MLREPAGDGGREAYTAIVRGRLLSRDIHNVAEAETVRNVEGEMCGAAMRGLDALPRSKILSRTNGLRRNLGYLASDRRWETASARIGKVRSRSR